MYIYIYTSLPYGNLIRVTCVAVCVCVGFLACVGLWLCVGLWFV